MIQPLDLLDKQATVKVELSKKSNELAFVECGQRHNHYKITISELKVDAMCAGNKQLKDLFINGLLLHEIAHVNYNSFDVDIPSKRLEANKAKVVKYIFNVLEDFRIEYKMMSQYPNTSIYFELLKNTFININGNGKQSKLEKYLKALFIYIRKGEVDAECLDLINFIIPIEAVLGDATAKETFDMAYVVYNYIEYMTSPDNNDVSYYFDVPFYKKYSPEEAQEVVEQFIDVKELDESEEGKIATETESDIKKATKDCETTIIDMTNSFRVLFEQINTQHVKEGEINFMRQQSAYINSITHDEDYDYLVTDKSYKLEFDFVLLRDTSGSIRQHQDEYFNSAVSILTSLENFQNVRTCAIAFSDDAVIEKHFDQTVMKSKMDKESRGGTNMLSALNILHKLDFKNKNKLILILTDGETVGEETCRMTLDAIRSDKNNLVVVIHVGDSGSVSKLVERKCSFDNLTDTVYTMIVDYINSKGVRAIYE